MKVTNDRFCRHRDSSPLYIDASELRSYSTLWSLDGFLIPRVMNYSGWDIIVSVGNRGVVGIILLQGFLGLVSGR